MIITPFLFLTFWNSTISGAQYYPNPSSNTSGTRWKRFRKELLWQQTSSRWIKNRRVRIPGTVSKTADGQLKFIGGDQVLRTPTLTKYHPSSRRSSRRPWRIRLVSTTAQSKKSLHINTVFSEISDILTKIASENIWEDLSEFVQQADVRRLLQVKPVAIVVPGSSTTSWTSSSSGTSPPNIITAERHRLNTDSSINWMWECGRASTGRLVA